MRVPCAPSLLQHVLILTRSGVNIFGYTPSLAHSVIALVIFLLWGVFAQTFHAVRAKGVKGGRAFAVLFVLGSAMDESL